MISNRSTAIVLISGRGSNLQSILDAEKSKSCCYSVGHVISNRPDADGLTIAKKANIPSSIIDHTLFPNRVEFDHALIAHIEAFSPDIVILAGFMRILTHEFTERFKGKTLNIHPSLLPKYTGLNTHQRAISAGDSHHGASIHFVTEELDGGPVFAQAKVPINKDDNAETLGARVLIKEHLLYPFAINLVASGEVRLDNDVIFYQNRPLASPIII